MTRTHPEVHVRFLNYDCLLRITPYAEGGQPCLYLIDAKDGSHVARCTINPYPSHEVAQDEVLVKDYAENKGMLAALIKAGVVEFTGDYIPLSPWASAARCRFLLAPSAEEGA